MELVLNRIMENQPSSFKNVHQVKQQINDTILMT